MAETTDVTGTETPPAATETATQPAGDSAENKGLKTRIDGFTAQVGRLTEEKQKLADKLIALEEEQKTETERRISSASREAVEKFKAEEFDPVRQRLDTLETGLKSSLAEKLEGLTPEQKALIPESLPIEEQHAQVDRLRSFTSGKTSVGASINPGVEGAKPVIAGSVFRGWQNLDKYTVAGKKKHYELVDEMSLAYRENRIDWNR